MNKKNNIEYKNKYIKYKNKYLEMKGGECNPPPVPGDTDLITLDDLTTYAPAN
jgi:hypothetical protein